MRGAAVLRRDGAHGDGAGGEGLCGVDDGRGELGESEGERAGGCDGDDEGVFEVDGGEDGEYH